MTSRILSSLIAVAVCAALVGLAVITPVPYVVFSPGPTFDILAEARGKEIVEISGRRTYRDEGEIRFTTVSVTGPTQKANIFTVMQAWVDQDLAVYPRESVYPPEQTAEEYERQSSVQMVTSQDAAIAIALRETGVTVPEVTEVLDVSAGGASDGALEVRDQLLAIDGEPVASSQDVADAATGNPPGTRFELEIRRNGEVVTVPVTTKENPEDPDTGLFGITVGPGFNFPFPVRVRVDENIGGPSAGLMFSLAVYDTLTPGSLTGGQVIAGTGTIDEEGKVGDIGGIAQKIVGAGRTGAKLFLVPAGNCAAALRAPEQEGMTLVKASTFDEVLDAVQRWADDPDAELPSCA